MKNFIQKIEALKEQYYFKMLDLFYKKHPKINVETGNSCGSPYEVCSFKGTDYEMRSDSIKCSCGCGQWDHRFRIYRETHSVDDCLFVENNINGETERKVNPKIEEILGIEVLIKGEEEIFVKS